MPDCGSGWTGSVPSRLDILGYTLIVVFQAVFLLCFLVKGRWGLEAPHFVPININELSLDLQHWCQKWDRVYAFGTKLSFNLVYVINPPPKQTLTNHEIHTRILEIAESGRRAGRSDAATN